MRVIQKALQVFHILCKELLEQSRTLSCYHTIIFKNENVWNIRSFSFCLFLQLVSIITDETPIEQMRNRLVIKDRGSSSSSSTPSSQLPHHPPHTRKPKLALLREVFGRGGFVLVIYIPATSWNAPLAAIFTKLLIMSLINHFSTERGSCFIFYSLICLSRFGLLLASPSPLQPSVSWRHHVLRPARLRRLTFGPWERERVRGKDGEKGFVRVCDCKRENFLPNLRCLIFGAERWRWRPRPERMKRVFVLDEWVNVGLCAYLYSPGPTKG